MYSPYGEQAAMNFDMNISNSNNAANLVYSAPMPARASSKSGLYACTQCLTEPQEKSPKVAATPSKGSRASDWKPGDQRLVTPKVPKGNNIAFSAAETLYLSRDGVPVEYWKISEFSFENLFKKFSVPEIERAWVGYLENKEVMCRALGVRGVILVIDIADYSLGAAMKTVHWLNKFGKIMAYFGENFYPDQMEKAILVHAPYYVGLGFGALGPLLSANTLAQISVCPGAAIPKEVQETIHVQDYKQMRFLLYHRPEGESSVDVEEDEDPELEKSSSCA